MIFTRTSLEGLDYTVLHSTLMRDEPLNENLTLQVIAVPGEQGHYRVIRAAEGRPVKGERQQDLAEAFRVYLRERDEQERLNRTHLWYREGRN